MFEIKTKNKTTLKRMLRKRDKRLSWMDQYKKDRPFMIPKWARELDQERKEIRCRLKDYGYCRTNKKSS